MLDCKNPGPCFYPRMYSEQVHFKPTDKVKPKEDLMDKDVYHAADIYTLSKRHVEGTEKRRLENRMMWILTGDEQYLKDSEAIGLETMVKQNQEAAQKKTLGTKRIKKRKGKRRNFFKRPNRWSALENSKSAIMEVD